MCSIFNHVSVSLQHRLSRAADAAFAECLSSCNRTADTSDLTYDCILFMQWARCSNIDFADRVPGFIPVLLFCVSSNVVQ
jgi:hypothetical protein